MGYIHELRAGIVWWGNVLEVLGNHFPHFRVERAGEIIQYSLSWSCPRVLLSLSAKVHEPCHDHTHLRLFVSDPDWGPYYCTERQRMAPPWSRVVMMKEIEGVLTDRPR